MTGLTHGAAGGAPGIVAVMPVEACVNAASAGWVCRPVPTMAAHVLVTNCPDREPTTDDLEALVLTAFSFAMSGEEIPPR
jgi:hypothetical protein